MPSRRTADEFLSVRRRCLLPHTLPNDELSRRVGAVLVDKDDVLAFFDVRIVLCDATVRFFMLLDGNPNSLTYIDRHRCIAGRDAGRCQSAPHVQSAFDDDTPLEDERFKTAVHICYRLLYNQYVEKARSIARAFSFRFLWAPHWSAMFIFPYESKAAALRTEDDLAS